MAGGEHPSCHYCFVTNYKLSKHIPQELEKESVAEYVVRYNRVSACQSRYSSLISKDWTYETPTQSQCCRKFWNKCHSYVAMENRLDFTRYDFFVPTLPLATYNMICAAVFHRNSVSQSRSKQVKKLT